MFTYLLLWTFIEGETNYKKILFYNLQRIRKTCFSYKVNLLALGASEQILYTNIFLIDHYQNNCSLPKLLKNEFGACEIGRGERGQWWTSTIGFSATCIYIYIYVCSLIISKRQCSSRTRNKLFKPFIYYHFLKFIFNQWVPWDSVLALTE